MGQRKNSNLVKRSRYIVFWNMLFVGVLALLVTVIGPLLIHLLIHPSYTFLTAISLPVISFFVFWIIIFAFYEILAWLKNNYYITPINEQDYQELIKYKLIHYTNEEISTQISDMDRLPYVSLEGRYSAKSNYNMKLRDKAESFVWFHREKTIGTDEPDTKSYLFSHGSEQVPRRFKVIIDPSQLDREKLFIRPGNRNIVYKGKVFVPAIIRTEFNCYEDKRYWGGFKSISFSLKFWHMFFHQTWGIVIDKSHLFRKKKIIFTSSK